MTTDLLKQLSELEAAISALNTRTDMVNRGVAESVELIGLRHRVNDAIATLHNNLPQIEKALAGREAVIEECIVAVQSVQLTWPGPMSDKAREALRDVLSEAVKSIRALQSPSENKETK